MDIWVVFLIIDWLLFIAISFTTLYFLVFAVLSLFNRQTSVPKAKYRNRFIVLIPAYMDDRVIFNTVNSVLGQSYPQRLFDVMVISDHQSEMTNMRLAQLPITLLTPDFEKSSKAKSLQYAVLNQPEFKIYDVVVVLDASNIIEPEFLEQINDAYEASGTMAIQAHRLPMNRDTASARLDSVFEEINNVIFRRGHVNAGLSASLAGSGAAFNFNWFKSNIMRVRSAGEDKELEAMLMREGIYIDYFDNIRVYDEKTRSVGDFHRQRLRWIMTQLRTLLTNIRFLPIALLNRQYDWADKIIQWMLVPRTIAVVIATLMSIVLPFIYFTLVIKWWIIAVLLGFAFAIATPNYLVDKNWDKDFLLMPFRTIWGLLSLLFKRRPHH
jgi:cellulose synthase/poly-beta-1,6-N-acetylglucosamine synthase-like glycosyltransferase